MGVTNVFLESWVVDDAAEVADLLGYDSVETYINAVLTREVERATDTILLAKAVESEKVRVDD